MAAQHVAEPHGHALHLGAAGKGLDEHLAQALGAAHDVGGVDGFVGRELHKTLDAVLGRRGEQVFGAKDVVFDGLGGADLHQRHMLMRRGVEDDRRVVGLEHFVQALDVADGAYQRDDRRVGAVLVAQLGLQLIGAVFVDVEDQQPARLVAHDLAAQLAADGPAAAGDQHDFVVQILRDLGVVELDLIAREEVGGVQLAEAGRDRVAVVVHRLRVGQHAHAAVGGVAEVDDLAEAVALERGDGDDDLHDMVLAHQFRYVGDGAAHRHALHAQVFFGQVVVHHADGVAKALVFVFAQVDRPGAGVAGADDEQRRAVFVFMGAHVAHRLDKPPQKAHAGNGRRVEHRAQRHHRAADGRLLAVDEVKQHDDARSQPRKAGQAGQVPHAGILPHDLIQAAEPEHDHIDRQRIVQHGRHGAQDLDPAVGVAAVKAQHHSQPIAKYDEAAVQQHQKDAARQALDDLFGILLHECVVLLS